MKESVHILLSIISGTCALLAACSWFIGVINCIRAGANLRPGFGWHLTMSGVILGSDIFTERGKRHASRARRGLIGFLLFWFLAFIGGWLRTATAP